MRPTKKQRALLDFIERFIAHHGYSPSYREIMNGCNYNSIATVAVHINNLISRGHLRKRDHSARSLELVKPGAVADAGADVSDSGRHPGEAWLLERIEGLFERAAHEELRIVAEALRALGLQAAAQEVAVRLDELSEDDVRQDR